MSEEPSDSADAEETGIDGDRSHSDGSGGEGDDEADVPLSELRERVGRRHDAEADESPLSEVAASTPEGSEGSELFEEVDVGEIDGEAVWDAVVEGDTDPEDLLGEEPGEMSPDEDPTVEPTADPDEHVVDKREYCQRCEFFSSPPATACENAGTEIVELVDNDHFRVRDCPKVAADDEALSGFASEE